MDTKQALDILIAVGICGITSVNITCSDCPLHTDDDEESPIHCKSWTDEDVAEAIRLLKDVTVADPAPAIPGKWMLVKMLNVPVANIGPVPEADVRATEIDSVPLYEEPLKGEKMSNDPYANAPTCEATCEEVYIDSICFSDLVIKPPKPIAKITLCGCIHLTLTDEVKGSFIKPTPEQIKNLKEMLCIDVELLEEGDENG